MQPDKNTDTAEGDSANSNQAPVDALSMTPDEVEADKAANPTPEPKTTDPKTKKVSPIKKFFRKVNVYFLIFLLLIAVGGVITTVNYLNSQKAPPEAVIEDQGLTEDTLKELANSDASVGGTSQTLTIQGNAVIEGQTLMRGDLNVAGNFQSGGSIQGPELTISGKSNLNDTQINSLQVAQNTAIQGNTTLRDLSVAGSATFSGAVTAPQITVTRLVLSGNAVLEVPNHISFTGPSPSRSINSGVLGGGGSASVNGSDTTGSINVNTGGNPKTGCFSRINFRKAYNGTPHVIVSPVGTAAGKTQYYVDRDSSGFSICTAAPAPANQRFGFDYFVTN